MIENKYVEMLKQFAIYYPTLNDELLDWWGTGPMSLAVKLNDGSLLEFNRYDNSLRKIDIDENDDERSAREVGHNLQKYIQLSGMTQADIAKKVGITNAMLSRYIHGTSIPSVVKARRIANVLGVGVGELFDKTYD